MLIGLISVLLHAMVVALILVWPRAEPSEPQMELPSPVAMVFERPEEGRRSVPTPSPTEIPTPPRPPPAQTGQTDIAEALPVPPPPPPPPEPTPRRPDAAPVRPRPPPPRAAPSFPTPQAYSFGPVGRPGGPPATDGSLGSAVAAAVSFGQFAKVTAGHVEPNWLNALHDWWQRHGYYPSQAVALQQAGRVRIEIVVDRTGKVRNVRLLAGSDSPWLNMGAQDVFRGSTVPPFPPNTRDDQITLELTINYIFGRR